MRRPLILAALFSLAPALAAPVLSFSAFDTGDDVFWGLTLTIDPNDEIGNYNAVDFNFTSVDPVLSPSTTPTVLKTIGSGTESGFNQQLVLSEGFIPLNLTSSPTALMGSWASFGSTAISFSTFSFLDVVATRRSAMILYEVVFANDGVEIDRQTGEVRFKPIPVPPAAPLLASGIAGFYWLRRRKAAQMRPATHG